VKQKKSDVLAEIVTTAAISQPWQRINVFLTGRLRLFGTSRSDLRAGHSNCSRPLFECVEEWIDYSEDKRTSSGWYVMEDQRIDFNLLLSQEFGRSQQKPD